MLRIVFALFVLGSAAAQATASGYDCAYDPKRTNLSRIVAADSTGGPLFGITINDADNRPQRRTLDLHDHEIVLTFDDGPLGRSTRSILDTLQKHCVKAIFFSVGKMALSQPQLIREVARRGHTVGSHTWSHPRYMHTLSFEANKLEIEKGFIAVSKAVGGPISPFFRFPGFRDSKEAVGYLAKRNISVWGTDVVSGDADAGGSSAEQITHDVLRRIRSARKGIVLFHDIKRTTAEALDGILTELEKDGFKVVHVVSNTRYQPDAQLMAQGNLFRKNTRTAASSAAPSSKVKVRDGSVGIMHTEWIDLDAAMASEGIRGPDADAGSVTQTRAGVQPASMYTETGWVNYQRVR